MSGLQWVLEVVLVALLAATLFYALRLERALGVLKRDRATLEDLVAGFNSATRQAQQGVDRLQEAADGAGRQMARQIETVAALKEDLLFLTERGDRLADRLDVLVRAGRGAGEPLPHAGAERRAPVMPTEAARPAAATAEMPRPVMADFARALHLDESRAAAIDPTRGAPEFRDPVFREPVARDPLSREAGAREAGARESSEPAEAPPRMRSQAERDLLKALRMAR